ncbi:MAG: acetyl-CoA acetyltransferase, partial [Proteobacteria bacterium]|nr:acetyl-CoA acetyltransferase [Pseudomonadota bacterium]
MAESEMKFLTFQEAANLVAAIREEENVHAQDRRKEISCAQLHDCFTIAELLEYEALDFSEPGRALDDV